MKLNFALVRLFVLFGFYFKFFWNSQMFNQYFKQIMGNSSTEDILDQKTGMAFPGKFKRFLVRIWVIMGTD